MPYKNKQDHLANQKRWVLNRKSTWLDENGPCQHCGSDQNLEIDHINPEEKEFDISRAWTWAQERLDKELAKCQVLCYDCHKAKTRQWYLDNLEHGKLSTYNRHACRCDPCRAASTQYAREKRARKKLREAGE